MAAAVVVVMVVVVVVVVDCSAKATPAPQRGVYRVKVPRWKRVQTMSMDQQSMTKVYFADQKFAQVTPNVLNLFIQVKK